VRSGQFSERDFLNPIRSDSALAVADSKDIFQLKQRQEQKDGDDSLCPFDIIESQILSLGLVDI
jgi:hypothetical protein